MDDLTRLLRDALKSGANRPPVELDEVLGAPELGVRFASYPLPVSVNGQASGVL